MRRCSLFLAVVTVVFIFTTLSWGVALAHTPSPNPCNDAVCYIDIRDNSFVLSAITILSPNPTTGDTVTVSWFNHGISLHSVTTGFFGSPDGIIDRDVPPGTFYNLTITQSLYAQILSVYSNGVVPYYCKYHFGMTATLTISTTPVPEFSPLTFLLTIALISIGFATLIRYRKRQTLQQDHVNSPAHFPS